MHKQREVFEEPENRNVRIWRYQSYSKFESVLRNQALFFCRVDRLDDAFEGSYPEAYRPHFDKDWEDRGKALNLPEPLILQFRAYNRDFRRALRRCVVVNCWHMNDCESEAMWKIYTERRKGVAIQSTFTRLGESFNNNKVDDIYIGKIKYIDYMTETFPLSNAFYPYAYKRRSFAYENEVRAAILKFPINDKGQLDLNMEIYQRGKFVSVDPNILIERVFISPTADPWLEKKARSALRKYGLVKEVIQSDLTKDPLY